VVATPIPQLESKQSALTSAIQNLAVKEVVEPVPSSEEGKGFYSILFVVPKKPEGWRPVLNLKPLNKFVNREGFKLDSIKSVKMAIRPGDFGTSLDLKDAYHHIAIHPKHRKFLRFHYQGKHWQFRALPFGLASAPRAFCRVLAPVVGWCHLKGIRLLAYLDDWLLLGEIPEELAMMTEQVCRMLVSLGWLISEEKSQKDPTPIFTFLGAVFAPRANVITPSQARINNLSRLASRLSKAHWLSARDMLEVLGHLASLIGIVPLARLHMRGLQMCMMRQWRMKEDSLYAKVLLDQSAVQDLIWWSHPALWLDGGPIWEQTPEMCVTTDASQSGWGAHWEDQKQSGVWPAHTTDHINALEMRAVMLALVAWRTLWRGRSILIRSDNVSTVQYINRQGGTISPRLCQLAVELWDMALKNNIWLSAAHIKGESNVLADSLSRGKKIAWSEWSLCPRVTAQIFQIYGMPNIDLFASRHNHKLPVYCSWDRDPAAFAQDALSIPWTNMWGYAYPPISLIPRILQKIRQSEVKILLVAPWWPLRPWFPAILDLLTDCPSLLPTRVNLLRLSPTTQFYPHPESLKLAVWPLSSNALLQKVFRKKLEVWSWPLGGQGQPRSMHPSMEFSVAGVVNSQRIPLRFL
jgi:hypothetical protein